MSKVQACSSSTNTPPQSFGWRNITGFPWAPIRGFSESGRIFCFWMSSIALSMSSTWMDKWEISQRTTTIFNLPQYKCDEFHQLCFSPRSFLSDCCPRTDGEAIKNICQSILSIGWTFVLLFSCCPNRQRPYKHHVLSMQQLYWQI